MLAITQMLNCTFLSSGARPFGACALPFYAGPSRIAIGSRDSTSVFIVARYDAGSAVPLRHPCKDSRATALQHLPTGYQEPQIAGMVHVLQCPQQLLPVGRWWRRDCLYCIFSSGG